MYESSFATRYTDWNWGEREGNQILEIVLDYMRKAYDIREICMMLSNE